jgi:hypothetical protein
MMLYLFLEFVSYSGAFRADRMAGRLDTETGPPDVAA